MQMPINAGLRERYPQARVCLWRPRVGQDQPRSSAGSRTRLCAPRQGPDQRDPAGAFGAPEPDRARSRRLGSAAMELMWALAADAPAVGIEANFRPYSEYERAQLSGAQSLYHSLGMTCRAVRAAVPVPT